MLIFHHLLASARPMVEVHERSNTFCVKEPGNIIAEQFIADLRPADASLVHPAIQSLQFQELDRLEKLSYLVHSSKRFDQTVVTHLYQIFI